MSSFIICLISFAPKHLLRTEYFSVSLVTSHSSPPYTRTYIAVSQVSSCQCCPSVLRFWKPPASCVLIIPHNSTVYQVILLYCYAPCFFSSFSGFIFYRFPTFVELPSKTRLRLTKGRLLVSSWSANHDPLLRTWRPFYICYCSFRTKFGALV
jgi:hypothetical protein